MASPYSPALHVFVVHHFSGPAGDTKYDIFNQSGWSRAKLRQERTQVRRPPPRPRPLKPASTGFVPGETV